MRHRLELDIRLVEPDVRVAPDAEHLQVDAAPLLDQRIIAAALLLEVLRHAVRHEAMIRPQVHAREQMLFHEIMIALRILARHAHILIEIERRHLRKIKPDRLMQLHELIVKPDGRAPRREPQHALRLQVELS